MINQPNQSGKPGQHRLMHRLGRIPPAEYETNHYARLRDGQKASRTKRSAH
jgi:hypothetical protein